ncbi:MAG: LamG-like jellyroll fold domain-containing protein [Bacteroidales bacterium]
MKKNYMKLLCAILCASLVLPVLAQEVNYKKYPDYSPIIKPDKNLSPKSMQLKAAPLRPAYVDNSKKIHFPAAFNQDGGSCGSASRIGYMFTYEINCLRNANAALEENIYPTHFTWLLTGQNSGKEVMAATTGVPNMKDYGGRTYSLLFGNQDCDSNDYGWMQGYNKWFEAMNNRISGSANMPISLETEEGRELFKTWLWDHCGDNDFPAGGIAGIGVASACTQENIPNTPANTAAGLVGKKYVKTWGVQVDHALTIVGYDDRIEFDLNGNGIYGEKAEDEVGAWIIANSWGNGWANEGFIYCPYKHARSNTSSDGIWGGWYWPEIYYARKNYRPLRTIKINMDYSKRSEIRLSAGVSSNINADAPDIVTIFDHFNYAGNGNGKGDSPDAETPMLGRWVDGIHSEPMEFGYDLTDLSTSINIHKPLKYFFIIDSKPTASGIGRIHNCSIIDYETDRNGIETPFNITGEGVTVLNKGSRTIISVVVRGESFNPPRNLYANGNSLVWQAPVALSHNLDSYRIYKDDKLITTVTGNNTTYTTTGEGYYTVSAVYKLNNETIESKKSNKVGFILNTGKDNIVREFKSSGFRIPGALASRHQMLTIEFWLKPTSLTNWNQQMGPGWGTFLIHSTSRGEVVAGWDVGNNRVTTQSNSLVQNRWQHIAIVVNNNQLTVYVNGINKGSLTSSNYSGMPAIQDFIVGVNSYPMNGFMDEFRIWNNARTAEQIQRYMSEEIGYPAGETNLIAYYKMDETTISEVQYLRDCAGGYNAPYTAADASTHPQSIDNTLLKGGTLSASFLIPEGLNYVGQPILLTNTSSPRVCKWAWTSEDAGVKDLNVPNPSLTFAQPGNHSIKLKVTDAAGNEANTTTVVNITEPTSPIVDFDMSTTTIPAGEHVSFINKTTNDVGCSYTWKIPGAEIEDVITTNAGATYIAVGTYEVTLTAKNATKTVSKTKTISVSAVAPKADFTVNPSVIILGKEANIFDKSKYTPTSWMWNFDSPSNIIFADQKNITVTPNVTGRYDITLKAGNDLGKDEITKKNALIVCNADGENGLKFDDTNDEVITKGIFADTAPSAFTIDWWMYPINLKDNCNRIGYSKETFMIKSDADGKMTAFLNGNSASTTNGFVIASEWHHYAVSVGAGSVNFYRDAILISSITLSDSSPAWSNGFCIGGSTYPMNAVIDELRIWNKVLSAGEIKLYGNAPIKDVNAVSDKLKLYYNFNQVSGDVKDLTANRFIGERKNFGPDGDAWSSSRGIFCLSPDATNTDITSRYLKNYSIAFRYVNNAYVNGTSRFRKLETGTYASPWVMENWVKEGSIITGFYVDATKSNSITLQTTWDNFASSVTDHKLYQQCTLPAGAYTFSAAPFSEFYTAGTELVISEGKGLPDTKDLNKEALAHTPLRNLKVNFVLTKETSVSLGLISNMSGMNCLTIRSFSLISKPFQEGVLNGIEEDSNVIMDNAKSYSAYSANGSIYISSAITQPIRIYTITGMMLFNETFSGTRSIQLPKGIYIVNSTKVIVF